MANFGGHEKEFVHAVEKKERVRERERQRNWNIFTQANEGERMSIHERERPTKIDGQKSPIRIGEKRERERKRKGANFLPGYCYRIAKRKRKGGKRKRERE